ncbi:hypothetical protein [Streptomyces sp. NPDC093676]
MAIAKLELVMQHSNIDHLIRNFEHGDVPVSRNTFGGCNAALP